MVVLEGGLGDESVDEVDAGLRSRGHGYGDGPVELDDWRGGGLGEFGVEGYDAGPVCLFGSAGAGVAGGDFGLQEVWSAGAADFCGAFDCGESAVNEELVPVSAVLIEEEDGLSGGGDAGPGA